MSEIKPPQWLSGGELRFTPRKIFPHVLTFGEARITLHADGRIEGDPEQLSLALSAATGHDPTGVWAIGWLLLRELRR